MVVMDSGVEVPQRSRAERGVWTGVGLVSVGMGGIGAVVPGLPSTVFFIIAASCFSKSSPRLERWVLELPTIGPMVRDYRAGLGIARRTKVWAIAVVATVITISAGFLIDSAVVQAAVVAAGVVGVATILFWVPTRERVLEKRAAEHRAVESV
mgnify:FL=1